MVIEIRATGLPGATCGPHNAVEVGVQVGREGQDFVPGDADAATWRMTVTRTEDGDWRGKAVHGKRGERFLYLVWRGRGPDGHPVMFRRAKLQLDAVSDDLGRTAAEAGVLVADLGLTDAKGEPVCASVRPPRIRWSAG